MPQSTDGKVNLSHLTKREREKQLEFESEQVARRIELLINEHYARFGKMLEEIKIRQFVTHVGKIEGDNLPAPKFYRIKLDLIKLSQKEGKNETREQIKTETEKI